MGRKLCFSHLCIFISFIVILHELLEFYSNLKKICFELIRLLIIEHTQRVPSNSQSIFRKKRKEANN